MTMKQIIAAVRDSVSGDSDSLSLLDARVLLLFCVLLAPVIVFWTTSVEIFLVWIRSDTFAHGIIIFPLALYLIAERRNILAVERPEPSLLGAVMLLGLVAFWYLAVLSSVAVAMQLAVALMMSAAVLTVFGWRITRLLAFPLFYLLFSIPVGEFLILPLMKWTAEFTVFALQLTGIPVYREGMFFYIPSGNFEVAKACSGIRYLIASIALGTFFANRFLVSTPRRLIFVGIAILVPILANGFRAYGIVMLAHLSGMTVAVGVDHIIYGWMFFGLVMFIMFGFGWWLHSREEENIHAPVDTSGADETVTGYFGIATVVALSATLFILFAPRVILGLSTSSSALLVTTPLAMPAGDGSWSGPRAADSFDWQPNFVGAHSVGFAEYTKAESTVALFIAVYEPYNRAVEMVSWQNQFIPEPWAAATRVRHIVEIADAEWQVAEVIANHSGKKILVWHWFETELLRTASDFMAKMSETAAALPGRRDLPRAIAMAVPLDEDMEASRIILEDFFEHMYLRAENCISVVGGMMYASSSDKPMLGFCVPGDEF